MIITVERIIERVLRKVQDSSFDNDFVLEAINLCNIEIASSIDISDLSTVSVVTIPANNRSVALPSDYHKNLSHCVNLSDPSVKRVDIYDSRRILDKSVYDPNLHGNVVAVAIDSGELWVYKTPTSDVDLDLYYHRLPDDLLYDGDFPSYIPADKVYGLFFNYAVSHIYDFIEDGVEGDKVNTEYHRGVFFENLNSLKLLIGPDPDEPYAPKSFNRHFNFEC